MGKFTKPTLLLATMFVLAGCEGAFLGDGKFYSWPIMAPPEEIARWNDAAVIVRVDPELTVSQNPEAYFPLAQIDWWEDPEGDRHAQVQNIMHTALHQGVAYLNGSRPVVFDVDVDLFHALTPRAREDGLWGWHDISYTVEIRDARDGAILVHRQRLYADLKAFQRADATASQARGESQKSRITAHVARSIRAWLGSSAQ